MNDDHDENIYGRANIFRSLGKKLQTGNDQSQEEVDSSIKVLRGRTFIQADVKQVYTLPITVPDSTSFLLVKAQFEYCVELGKIHTYIDKVGKYLGLVQHSLLRTNKPHTIKNVFQLTN